MVVNEVSSKRRQIDGANLIEWHQAVDGSIGTNEPARAVRLVHRKVIVPDEHRQKIDVVESRRTKRQLGQVHLADRKHRLPVPRRPALLGDAMPAVVERMVDA